MSAVEPDLARHAEQIARALLGEPNEDLSTKRELRYGTHGSLAVEIRGKKAGTWYCHETKTGGGMLDLIVRERGAVATPWRGSGRSGSVTIRSRPARATG
jgi:hypothetical protein